MYYVSSASNMRKARGFFSQEKVHSKRFEKPCLSSARSLGKEGHTLPCWERLNLGDNKKRNKPRSNGLSGKNKPVYCPFR